MLPSVQSPSHHPFEWLALPAFAVTGTVGRKIIGKGGEKITFFSKKNEIFCSK